MLQKSSDSSDRERQVKEIIIAYLDAVDAGQKPDRQEWLQQYPEFAAELEAFLANYDWADRVAEPLRHFAALVAPAPPERVASGEAATMDFTQSARLPAGTTVRHLGDYELLEEIARGAMGVVYKARQISLNGSDSPSSSAKSIVGQGLTAGEEGLIAEEKDLMLTGE